MGLALSRAFVAGLFCGLLLLGCAGFSYKHYGLAASTYEGTLLAPEEKDDIPLKVCAPDENASGKCIVMIAGEFYRMKQDYLETQKRLIDCEKGRD